MALVCLREAVDQVVLVLPNAMPKVVRHSDIQDARYASDHVDAVVVLFHASQRCHPDQEG
jgi:hypothetical protein